MKISFLIITYKRCNETLEAVQNILEFLDVPEEVEIQIVVVNNSPEEDYSALIKYLDEVVASKQFDIIYKEASTNLGVAGGRNLAMSLASGDVFVSLDDDAEFREKDMINLLLQLFSKYQNEPVSIFTFKVVEQEDGSIDIATKKAERYRENEFYTTYFKGGAHAIKRELYDLLGGYGHESIYGAEEYDLSYKAIGAGFKIVHSSAISILHKRSLGGRISRADSMSNIMINKSLLAYKYLPRPYYFTHVILWSIQVLLTSKFNVLLVVQTISSICRKVQSVPRNPISAQARKYILKEGGRLIY